MDTVADLPPEEYDYRFEAMKAQAAWRPYFEPDGVEPLPHALTRQVLPVRRYRLEIAAVAVGLFSIGYTLVSMLSF